MDAQQSPTSSAGRLPAREAPGPGQATGGLAGVAHRLARRTTDLVVVGCVLAAGLTAARELIGWWRSGPPEVLPPRQEAALLEEASYSLEFGDQDLVLDRGAARGTRDQALKELFERCALVCGAAAAPCLPAGRAEETLLAHTARLKPAISAAADSAIYHVRERLEFVVGVRNFGAGGDPAAEGRRVVCWGLMAPRDGQRWNLYTFSRAAPQSAAVKEALVPLPEEAERTLAIRERLGVSLTGFRGQGPPQRWMRFFDEWFAGQPARPAHAWQALGHGWNRRFLLADKGAARTVDVQLATNPQGRLVGLVIVTPED